MAAAAHVADSQAAAAGQAVNPAAKPPGPPVDATGPESRHPTPRPCTDPRAPDWNAGVRFHIEEKYPSRSPRTARARPSPAAMNTSGSDLSTPDTAVGALPQHNRAPPSAAPAPRARVGPFTGLPHPPPAAMVGLCWPLTGSTKPSILML